MHKKKLLFVMLALMLIFNLVSVDSVVYAERLSASAESTLAENVSEVVDEDQKSDLLSTAAQEEEASPEAATATTAEPEKEETEKEEEETVLTDQISESEEVVSESSADLKSQTVSDEFLPFADGEESLLPPHCASRSSWRWFLWRRRWWWFLWRKWFQRLCTGLLHQTKI